jgi:hypothetical protein
MNNDSNEHANTTAAGGECKEPGKEFKPSEMPEGEIPDRSKRTPAPMGLPISDDEYERLKKKAEQEKVESEETAQQDPSAQE